MMFHFLADARRSLIYYHDSFLKFPRAVIDYTEIPLQRPSINKANSQIYSNFKSTPTAKVLVACTPGITVSYISKLAGGAVRDKKLDCLESLKKLTPWILFGRQGIQYSRIFARLLYQIIAFILLKKKIKQFNTA